MITWLSLSKELQRHGCRHPRLHMDRLAVLASGRHVSIYFHKCKVLVGDCR